MRISEIVKLDGKEETLDTLASDEATAVYGHYRRVALDSNNFKLSSTDVYGSLAPRIGHVVDEMCSEVLATERLTDNVKEAATELKNWFNS